MESCTPSLVDAIRTASRQMVRELGFMQATIAGTGHPPSAVHAIMEIGAVGAIGAIGAEAGKQPAMTAAQLADILNLEKSSVSRLVRKLVAAGELKETPSTGDARAKHLTLTAKGKRTLAAIHAFGRQQVTLALQKLPVADQHAVSHGLSTYAEALAGHRRGEQARPAPAVDIVSGYRPGVIGRVTDMHAGFYARNFGFGQYFESLVATGIAEFAPRLADPRNGLWTAWHAGRMVGSVAIDGQDLGERIAHLRWFIVDDGLRGAGAGRKLLDEALAFCDRHGHAFDAVHLWTFQGLDAARRLYEACGFVLAEERSGRQWGSEVVEQRFIRQKPC
ncbi:MAG: MarR family transcriptional regulator [Comamonadaceae bacterium]|nr:MAG: MarR family transcriptional regulator [Comamonadaceae bacterium]